VKRLPLICALTAALALGVPAAAFAQSAGDEQYQDPLPSQPAQPRDEGAGSSPGSGSVTPPSAPAAPAPEAPQAEAAEATPAAAEIPRTGADAALMAVVGAALLATGAAARLAVPRRR
jgi:hypothetical protein